MAQTKKVAHPMVPIIKMFEDKVRAEEREKVLDEVGDLLRKRGLYQVDVACDLAKLRGGAP